MDNVIVTPHVGSATYETRQDVCDMSVENITAGIEGRQMPSEVRPWFGKTTYNSNMSKYGIFEIRTFLGLIQGGFFSDQHSFEALQGLEIYYIRKSYGKHSLHLNSWSHLT